jgi:CubicO group peptidase (beta-lactamase class C family)
MMNYRQLFVAAMLLALVSASSAAQSIDTAKIKRVEQGLMTSFVIKGQPIPAYTITDRMKYHKVPGLSIAFIENGKISWARQYGVKQSGSSDPVTDATLFQAGSVSKPIAAAVSLSLVKDGQLNLDNDVNTYLKSWHVPENKFVATEKVTLRRILTHSAGVTVHGFQGYAPDSNVPSLRQVLDGESPAMNKKIVVDTVPGSIWRYSGGGYTIMEQMLEDISRKRFASLAHEMIFEKLGMTHSTFQQPLDRRFEKDAARGHGVFGKPFDKNFIQPELAAGGLWSTPTDLARFTIDVVKASGESKGKVLNQELASLMINPQFKNWGLGFSMNGNAFSHPGSCEGFRTILVYHKDKAEGVVMMTNAENGDNLMREIINSIAKTYGWSNFTPREREMYTLAKETYEKYQGNYDTGSGILFDIRFENGLLNVYVNEELRTTLYPESEKRFFILEDRHAYTFITNDAEEVESVAIAGVAPTLVKARKIK